MRETLATRIRDHLFAGVFRNLFVFNVLFEDAEVDEWALDIQGGSRVLALSAAGCGAAGMISRRPAHVDMVDFNFHHLALAALKVAAAKQIPSYDEFYQLFGLGSHPRPEALIRRLVATMPRKFQTYWSQHWGRFTKNFYDCGLLGRCFAFIRQRSGADEAWLRRLARAPVEERVQETDRTFATAFNSIARFTRSPLMLLSQGVNFWQQDRILKSFGTNDYLDVVVGHLKRVATTDLERNWIAWLSCTGHFNHDVPAAHPPYLRREAHEGSVDAPTTIGLHHCDLFRLLGEAGPNTWTHYSLSDVVDWMPPALQWRLFAEVHRTAIDGATIVYRSVEPGRLLERIGLGRYFDHVGPLSERATQADRTRQYAGVNVERVLHPANTSLRGIGAARL